MNDGLLLQSIIEKKYPILSPSFLSMLKARMEFILTACLSFSCPQLARVCYVYFLSKFVEYLDTVSAFSDIIGKCNHTVSSSIWN